MASIEGDVTVRADGRKARSLRTRRAIVDALRSLHHEGELRPTAPRVAERAGVSLRTVWQHFDDLESLFAAAGERDAEIAATYVRHIDPAAPRAERVAAVVDQRAEMYEAMAPVWRAARLQEPFSQQIRDNRDRLVALGRVQLEEVFAAEAGAVTATERATLLSSLHAVTSWALWESMRTELKMTGPEARQALIRIVSKLTSVG